MIHVTVSYPNGSGTSFDHAYYRDKHLPLVVARLGAALKRVEIDRAVAGLDPATPAAWVASGHMFFDSVEAFQAAFAPHAAEILGDVPNFSNVQPAVVISESFAVL